MPDLSVGTLIYECEGFDGVRLITFIFQTRLWNKKKKRKKAPVPKRGSCCKLLYGGLRGKERAAATGSNQLHALKAIN